MHKFELSEKSRRLLWMSLLFMLVARIVASASTPLTDTTEARYGEIARKMLEVGDWITPLHDYDVPYWAKPPLSMWLSAGSMKWFGVNEFAARLPSMLLGVSMLVLVWFWVSPRRGRDFALATVAVLGSMVLFFVGSGAVMTDASLAFCTTLAMISFWQALHTWQKYPGYLFFVALGIGLLAKGPIVVVLVGIAIIPWVVMRKNGRAVWNDLPWIRGTAFMLLIALPWYVIAEHKTPGFVAYFLLGEHFGRFLHAGWSGDRYGHAHSEMLGMIWIYWLASASPWSLLIIAGVWNRRRQWRTLFSDDSGMVSYLLLWSFTSILFFSFTHNVVWSYALPALPAFAILIVELWVRFRILPAVMHPPAVRESIGWRQLTAGFATPAALLIMAGIYANEQQGLLKSSQRDTAQYYMAERPSEYSGLYYYHRRYYSSEFYSSGKAEVIEAGQIDHLLSNDVVDFLVIREDYLRTLPEQQLGHFKTAKRFDQFVVLEELRPVAVPALSSTR